LYTEVLFCVRQVGLLGDRDAVVAYERRTPALLDEDGLGFRAERYPHGIGKLRRAMEEFLARNRTE